MCLVVPPCTTTMRAIQTPSTAMKVTISSPFTATPFYIFSLKSISILKPKLVSCSQSSLSKKALSSIGSVVIGQAVVCSCFHRPTSGVFVFPLAWTQSSPLPHESLNKQLLEKKKKKQNSSPAKRKTNTPLSPTVCWTIFGQI